MGKEKVILGSLVWLAGLLLFVASCSGSETSAYQPNQPNMIFVLTDGLDLASAQKMPQIRSRLIEEGTSFENAFVSHPVCCPSRATVLTGLYAHNHNVKGNDPPREASEHFALKG